MLDYSVSYFLSQAWRNKPLYAEKLIPLLDTILSNNFVFKDKVASAFYELINKYQNTTELPLESLKEFIRENGYGYILDLVIQDEEHIKPLFYLLVLIHQLKGNKKGLQLVLSLFQDEFDPDANIITQWFELTPVATENTFEINSQVELSRANKDFIQNFGKFVKRYVYPELTRLKLNYTIEAAQTQIPYSIIKLHYKVKANLN